MLDDWYNRSVSNVPTTEEEDEVDDSLRYKTRYKNLKRKLKYLIYENECFQDALKAAQRRLLIVNKDRSFLLDRLLQYEKVEASSSESDDTESSDDQESIKIEIKKRRVENSTFGNGIPMSSSKGSAVKKKRNPTPRQPKPPTRSPLQMNTVSTLSTNMISDGHMTPEEVERHLQSRQSYMELVPEKAPPTVPTEMFSNDPSLDSFQSALFYSESNDIAELETSPSNMGEDLSIDMIAE